jgi:hypothetical protein
MPSPNNDSSVFVLGAGFSVAEGFPLMRGTAQGSACAAFGASFPGGGGSFTPAFFALDSPIVITCLAERDHACPRARARSLRARIHLPVPTETGPIALVW